MQPILLVEDDRHLRELIQAALEDEGWTVVAAAYGRQALEWGSRHRPALVVLDWGLPDLDGQAVAAGLRAAYGEHLPIILITADGRASAKASQVGALSYFHKPFELADLIESIRQGIGRS